MSLHVVLKLGEVIFMIPLSTRMRPKGLDEFVGQRHFMHKSSLLYNAIEKKNVESVIFFGPSGSGKTTLARLIAEKCDSNFVEINASKTGIKELKEVLSKVKTVNLSSDRKNTYVYIDEIHRWNKLQQDVLLETMEEGVIKVIGSTTENPYFSINNAILSRVGKIYEFKPLENSDIKTILRRTLEDKHRGFGNLDIECDDEIMGIIADMSSGDARIALETLGFIVDNIELPATITAAMVEDAMQRKVFLYDNRESKYNLLSALQKSIRGSDPDAAIHYFARLIDAGADVSMIGRRLLVIASEDIAMAYPSAISIVNVCVQAAHMVGLPEAAINLAQAVIVMATSPKSNSSYVAYERAIEDIRSIDTGEIPDALKDNHYGGAKSLGYGKGYKYPHNYGGYVKQQYLPDVLYEKKVRYYEPTDNGSEKQFKEFLERLRNVDGDNSCE